MALWQHGKLWWQCFFCKSVAAFTHNDQAGLVMVSLAQKLPVETAALALARRRVIEDCRCERSDLNPVPTCEPILM